MSGKRGVTIIKRVGSKYIYKETSLTLGGRSCHHWLPREGVVILKTKSSFCNSFLLKISDDQK